MLIGKFCKCITLADAESDATFGLEFLGRLFDVSFYHAKKLESASACANMWVSLIAKSPQTNVPIIVDHILCLGIGDKSASVRQQAPLCKVIAQACYGTCRGAVRGTSPCDFLASAPFLHPNPLPRCRSILDRALAESPFDV